MPLVAAAHFLSPGKPTGFVNDFAKVIPAADKVQLESELSTFAQKTGIEISAVTIPALGDESIEEYAVALFADWGLGKKGKDNGVLLLVAPSDRQVRIEVGYGLEGALTDAQSGRIITQVMAPLFKAGDFAGGIKSGVTAIEAAVVGEGAEPATQPVNMKISGQFFFLIFFIIVGIVRFLLRSLAVSKSWWLGGVFGAVGAGIWGLISASLVTGVIAGVILVPLGLLIDYLASKRGIRPPGPGGFGGGPWLGGGRGFGGGGFGGGGFGGFGGGGSGGGGASGKF